ncbi:MAG: hypothetical protein RLN76_06305 [Phycisphaeraceae bacterium]
MPTAALTTLNFIELAESIYGDASPSSILSTRRLIARLRISHYPSKIGDHRIKTSALEEWLSRGQPDRECPPIRDGWIAPIGILTDPLQTVEQAILASAPETSDEGTPNSIRVRMRLPSVIEEAKSMSLSEREIRNANLLKETAKLHVIERTRRAIDVRHVINLRERVASLIYGATHPVAGNLGGQLELDTPQGHKPGIYPAKPAEWLFASNHNYKTLVETAVSELLKRDFASAARNYPGPIDRMMRDTSRRVTFFIPYTDLIDYANFIRIADAAF